MIELTNGCGETVSLTYLAIVFINEYGKWRNASGALGKLFGVSAPAMSRHLPVLRKAELVRRRGNNPDANTASRHKNEPPGLAVRGFLMRLS